MPLYYFNIFDSDVTMGEEGVELADDNAAKAYGLRATRLLAAETASQGYLVRCHRVDVVDAQQNIVEVIRFDDAVKIRD